MLEHPENYRWSNVGRSRFDCIRINVEIMEAVISAKKDFKRYCEDIKIAKHISHTVHPPKEEVKTPPKISHTIYPPDYEPPKI